MMKLKKISQDLLEEIQQCWVDRVRSLQHVRPGTKRFRELECEYFVGAMAALHATGYELLGSWPLAVPGVDAVTSEAQIGTLHRPRSRHSH